MSLEEFWNQFLKETNRPLDTPMDYFSFGLEDTTKDYLCNLVLSGKKTATSSSYLGYEIDKEELPRVGELSIIMDSKNNPKCVIETKKVQIIPFRKMTFDLCRKEGEDESLDSWRNTHIAFFKEEGNILGYTFTEDMPIVFEEFEVIYMC